MGRSPHFCPLEALDGRRAREAGATEVETGPMGWGDYENHPITLL